MPIRVTIYCNHLKNIVNGMVKDGLISNEERDLVSRPTREYNWYGGIWEVGYKVSTIVYAILPEVMKGVTYMLLGRYYDSSQLYRIIEDKFNSITSITR